jgi:cell division protein FtsW
LKLFSKPFLLLAFVLLVLVLIPGVGITRNNATRWLGVGDALTFQPSEVAKMAVILYFADRLSKQKGRMERFWRDIVYPYGILLIAMSALLLKEPHLSGTVLILSIGAVLLIVGGLPRKLVFGGLAGGILAVVGYVKAVSAGWIHYGASRIATWHDPFYEEWFRDEGWQLGQSQLAIGSGGLLGVGLGKSRQKFLYLPEEHNDFIFAVICEELGYVGAALIILLFMALILRGYWIALHAPDRFGSLLVVGVMTHIALQTFLNIAVVTGLVPTTGISLPFFSYGGTALMMQLVEMGVVLSVSRQMVATKEG